MTTLVNTSLSEYVGDGVRTFFEYNFSTTYDFDVWVSVDGQQVEYTKQDNGVLFAVAPPSGARIVINRLTELAQPLDFVPYEAFHGAKIEEGMDRLFILKGEAIEFRGKTNLRADQTSDASVTVENSQGDDAVIPLWGKDKAGMFAGSVTENYLPPHNSTDSREGFLFMSYEPAVPLSGMKLWLDASRPGGTADQWDDVSGNGHHFVKTTGRTFPTISGGRALFHDDGIECATFGPDMPSGQENTCELFFALKKTNPTTDTTSAKSAVMNFGTATFNRECYWGLDGNRVFLDFGKSNRAAIETDLSAVDTWYGDWHIVNIQVDASTLSDTNNTFKVFVDGSGTPGFTQTGGFQLDFESNTYVGQDDPTSNAYYFRGEFTDIIAYGRLLDSSERAAVIAYMQNVIDNL